MNYYNRIKSELVNNEIYKKIKDYSKNRNDLKTYYNVGKIIVLAQGGKDRANYGDGLIQDYSERLTQELGRGYTVSALKRMRKFYNLILKGATLSHQLLWSHYIELLKFDDVIIINYYVNLVLEYNLSVRELRSKIRNNEYERLDNKTKCKLVNKKGNNNIHDFIKHPILIKNSYNYEYITEKILKQLILEDIDYFLSELGNGFTYVKSEYKIKLGDRYNYIDLLLFNVDYNCYVVIELKVTELKKQYIGQIKLYMNYIDKKVRKTNQGKTIGIIIVRRDNEFVMEYCSDVRIYRTTYELLN